MQINKSLPLPNAATNTQSEALLQKICAEIERDGAITFARYMELALYSPELGYYRSHLPKLGIEGDFVTAPEISPLFSQCVARQCQQVIQDIKNSSILEFGAGKGTMASAILQELAANECLPEKYYILEISADLQYQQQQLLKQQLPQYFEHIEWLDTLPKHFQGIMLANEVLDAMPVHKFGWMNGERIEFYVSFKNGKLDWEIRPISSDELAKQINQLELEERLNVKNQDYSSELNLFVKGWINSIASILEQGLLLIIDYGFPRHEYYHHERNQGTIMCHYQHRAHSDPLILPGIQDITAHVDFTAVAEAAVAAELQVSGYTHQAGFLINCGLHELTPTNLAPIEQYQLAQQIKRLTLPSEMGELFKAMALTKNYSEQLSGFQEFDQKIRL